MDRPGYFTFRDGVQTQEVAADAGGLHPGEARPCFDVGRVDPGFGPHRTVEVREVGHFVTVARRRWTLPWPR